MGVRGLATLVDNHSQDLLRDFCVQDTKLVIDGFGLLWFFLESRMSKVDPMPHGGEYVRFQNLCRKFFQSLLDCRCGPVVIFDGGSDLDGKKKKTKLQRFQKRIKRMNAVTTECEHASCPQPLDLFVMLQVLEEMDVDFAFSQFEADREIAMLANHWGCPVLGKDSDYFILDIVGGYIPFPTLKWDKQKPAGDGRFYLPGKLYTLDRFCDVFRINKEMVPLFGTLCFNDYFFPGQVKTFLSMYVYKANQGNMREGELLDILQWLSQWKTLKEGLQELFEYLRDREKLEQPLMASIGVYNIRNETSCLLSFFEKSENVHRDLERSPFCRVLRTPLWIAEAHRRGDILNTCIDIMSQKCCFTHAYVENPSSPSAWLPSERIFATFAGIFLAQTTREAETRKDCTVTVYIREGYKVGEIKVTPTLSLDNYGQLPALSEIPSLSKSLRQRLLLDVFVPRTKTSVELLVSFPIEFRLALLVTVYWINITETHIRKCQLTSLLLGWVFLYKEPKERRGKDGKLKNRRQFSRIRGIESEANRTLRETKPDADISQAFMEWQNSFLYAVYLNKLLEYPLLKYPPPERPDLSLLFSGLLMHGLVHELHRDFPRCTLDHVDREIKSFLPHSSAEVKELFKSMYNFVLSNLTSEARARMDMLEVGIVPPRMEKKIVIDLEAAEQDSRRNCLIFSGVVESGNENTDDKIMAICEQHLDVKLKSSDIDRSSRLTNHAEVNKGSASKQKNPRPRNIIVTFSNYEARKAVYGARIKLNGKETGMFINEDLTRERTQLLWKVKKGNYEYVDSVWTQDGRVMARNKSGKKVALTSDMDLSKLDQLKE